METIDWLVAAALAKSVLALGSRIGLIHSSLQFKHRLRQLYRCVSQLQTAVIPGFNDSHRHPIRGGLNYNVELRWDGVPSLTDALRVLKDQAARTPAPQ